MRFNSGMNIKFYPTTQYTPSFSSKKPEIRKADDLQRKTRTAFPFFSPSYADGYYSSCASFYQAPNTKKAVEHWDNMDRLDKESRKMSLIREERRQALEGRYNFSAKFTETVKDVQKYRLANCEEAATMVLATLLANGYTNSFKCSLKLITSIYEKGAKESKFSLRDSLDHACVITKSPKDKKYIILDSWYGFADSMSGAKGRYKQLYDEKKLQKSKQKAISQFTNFYQNKYKNFDINNFEVRQHIDFDIKEMPGKQDHSKLQQIFSEKYPELITE